MKNQFRVQDFLSDLKKAAPPIDKRTEYCPSIKGSSDNNSEYAESTPDKFLHFYKSSDRAFENLQPTEPQETIETMGRMNSDLEEIKDSKNADFLNKSIKGKELLGYESVKPLETELKIDSEDKKSENEEGDDLSANSELEEPIEINFDVKEMQSQIYQLTKECIEYQKKQAKFEEMKKEIDDLKNKLSYAMKQNSVMFIKLNKYESQKKISELVDKNKEGRILKKLMDTEKMLIQYKKENTELKKLLSKYKNIEGNEL